MAQSNHSDDTPLRPLTLRERLGLIPFLAKMRELSRCPPLQASIYDIHSIRGSPWHLSRKQGEVLVPCCQHGHDALPYLSKVGHTHVALLYWRYHYSSIPGVGGAGKTRCLDGHPPGKDKVALDRTTAGRKPEPCPPPLLR